MVPVLHGFHEELARVADFVTVYIEEAHAADEWPIGSRLHYKQPTSIAERAQIVKDFIDATGYKLPIVIDPVFPASSSPPSSSSSSASSDKQEETSPVEGKTLIKPPQNNPFEKLYAPWPVRFYVIHRGRLLLAAEPMEGSFSLAPVRDAILGCLPPDVRATFPA